MPESPESRESPRLIDSHCHLQSLAPDDRRRALDEARRRGVSGFLVPAIQLSEADDILDFCNSEPDVWCALGVHPHEAQTWRPGDASRLRELLSEPKVLAIGECGLDFHYNHCPPEVQIRVLRAQWDLACELSMPVVVHNRESDEQMIRLVREPDYSDLRGDFHSFSGNLSMAVELIERDFYLGVSGMVTFRNADNIREIVSVLKPAQYLLETDTPYLAPVPYRGKENRPANVLEVAQRTADEMGIELDTLKHQTTANFERLFSPRSDSECR